MSRSYKHTPYCGLTKDRFYKKYANKRLRQKKLAHDFQHNSYKKDLCSWKICDYYCIETKNFENYYRRQVDAWYELQRYPWRRKYSFPTREKVWKEYIQMYRRK